MVATLRHSRDRLDAVIAEVGRLNESEFPYSCSREALRIIEGRLWERKEILRVLDEAHNREEVQSACAQTLSLVMRALPYLGFILRSTNVRNAFEIYGPLRRLCSRFIGPDARLVISSEWEDYSPFTKITGLLPGNYVLIALPAPESSNPLVLPLAGHELGHAIWAHRKLARRFQADVISVIAQLFQERFAEYQQIFPNAVLMKPADIDGVGEIFVNQNKKGAAGWALRQIEEYFCDILGVRLFAESYLHAFAYLFSPTPKAPRSENYPNMDKRVYTILRAAERFGVAVPAGYAGLFNNFVDHDPNLTQKLFLLSVADTASFSLVDHLLEAVDELCRQVAAPMRDKDEVDRIVTAFRKVVPPVEITNLSNVINAAWQASNDPVLWKDIPAAREQRSVILHEIVLKTTEVLDVLELLKEHHDSEE